MENNFVRTGFFDGVSYIFGHFFEYFKLFLFTILNSFVISMIGKIPYLGVIFAFIFGILLIAFIPYGVTLIVCEIKIDFSIYEKFINFIANGTKKEVIMQYLKLIVFIIIAVLTVAIISYMVLKGGSGSFESLAGVGLIAIILIFVIFIASIKMMTTLYMKLISSIYEDDELEFYKTQASKYSCMFLWNLVPIINLISLYTICTVFARDIKSYFDL